MWDSGFRALRLQILNFGKFSTVVTPVCNFLGPHTCRAAEMTSLLLEQLGKSALMV